MRALLKKYWVALFTATVLLSCTEEAIVSEVPKTDSEHIDLSENDYKVSIEEAEEYLIGFLKHLDDPLTYGSNGGRKIKNVEAIRSNRQIQTYASENDLHVDLDTLMYAINFENGQGFALMAADRRTTPIYAIIDEGEYNYDEAIKNPGFAMFMQNAIVMALEDIKNSNENKAEKKIITYSGGYTYHIKEKVKHRLETRWSQGYPYNMYCPGNATEKYPAGCWPIAVAQVVAYYRSINNVSWEYNNSFGSATMHWNRIIEDCKKWPDGSLDGENQPQSSSEVAHLIRHIGIAMGADYGKKGTSVWENRGINYLRNYCGLSSTTTLNTFNAGICATFLRGRHSIVLMKGAKGSFLGIQTTSGHAWVIDGYIEAYRQRRSGRGSGRSWEEVTMFHCNYGWGGIADGYYYGEVFDTQKGPEIKDESDLIDDKGSSNYKSLLKMCLINSPRNGVYDVF